MARIDRRSLRSQPNHLAPLRAGADSWRALAGAAVALMGVLPALVVGALLLLEAVFSNPRPVLASRSAEPAPNWPLHAPRLPQFSTACRQFELATCVRD
jgi:hypothetical protein